MNICTCCHSTGAKPIDPWTSKISEEMKERIRQEFPQTKPMNKEPLALPERAPSAAAPKREPVVIEMGAVAAFHTGYARIDNAITDALRGKSQELKDSVYDIIRSDLVPHNVHGLIEEDRLALIGLGVAKAEYLADQFMDSKTKGSFMDAIRQIARIGTEGTRVGSCEMSYQVKHAIGFDGEGHVIENQMDEFLYAMEKFSPKDFETYQKMCKSSQNSGTDACMFALRWALENMNQIAGNRSFYHRYKDEQYEKLEKVKLDETFSGADTSDKDRFLASVKEKLMANRNLQIHFFLDRMSKMAQAPAGYLTARKLTLWARA